MEGSLRKQESAGQNGRVVTYKALDSFTKTENSLKHIERLQINYLETEVIIILKTKNKRFSGKNKSHELDLYITYFSA